jgi:nicotinate-nucleotide pyrophosphorylase (carboxylating)
VIDLNAMTLPELYQDFRSSGLLTRLFELARDEDLGPHLDSSSADPTSHAMYGATVRGRAALVARQSGTVAGLAAVEDVLHAFHADVDFLPATSDGQACKPRAILGTLEGSMRGMLAAERTLLNTLGRLSGIATRTREFVNAVAHTKAKIYDTRKTSPGLRLLEKYAVRAGGGCCHRLGLYDAALFKDNHLAELPLAELPASLAKAVRRAHDAADRAGLRFVQVEVDTLDQLRAILSAGGCGCALILLDNMPPAELREAVGLRDQLARHIQLEASGGITLENIAAVAETGVDRISLGTITHGARWLDIGLDMIDEQAR